ncbi:MAG: short-chain dehydrogenase [Firmicutes bacterium HGW-Firmicutes-20]|jgi:short-subunit dehydrogenase|nr:MAG: short-chain dehydrogenase [Firmicutes bacterium HGW-Firmicutes-20]
MNLNGKRIILTGASSGIGLALQPLLHQKGARVLAVGRKAFTPDFSDITYMQADVSTQAGVDSVFAEADKILGGVDIFIANAGFSYYEGAEHADWDHIEAIFDTNVTSPLYAFHKMKKIKGNQPFQFAVTASAMSFLPLPGYALYSATKHSLQGFFEAARFELPSHQVISLIHPIATKTAFFKNDNPDLFPTQTAETVAGYYLDGIEKNKAHIYPSKIFQVIHHLGLIHPLIKKQEAGKLSKWRTAHD